MVVESRRKQLSLKRRREAHERQKKGVLAVLWAAYYQWQANVLAAATILFSCDRRSPKRHRDEQRAFYLSTLTRGADEECVSELRLNIASFDFLCALLRNRGLLRDTREVSVEEEVASLLHILGHGVRIRTMATRLFRSGETISRHFHEVLNVILSISPNFIKRAGPDTPSGPYPFEGALGAIDGTHILAHLPLTMQSSYRNRKGTLTQNVLAACGFDMKFQYVLPGWEGSATDARILQHALSRPDGLIVPPDPKKIRRNTVFNSAMDDEMLGFLMEQIDMGRRGDRGFKGHPKANTWRSRTIDYDKLSMVFGRDSATGRFARSSVDATTPNVDSNGQGNTQMSGSFNIRDEDMMQELRMSSNGGGGSHSGSRNRKRKAVMTEFMAGLEKSSALIRAAIDGVAEKMGDPIERLSTLVYRELKKIPDLSDYDVEIAHEWLNANIDKASAFLDINDKNTWILRRMQRIRNYVAS